MDQRRHPLERRRRCHREVQRCGEPGRSSKRDRNHRGHHDQHRPGGGGRAATASPRSRASARTGASDADSTDTGPANAGTDAGADAAVTIAAYSAASDTSELHLFRLADGKDDLGIRGRGDDRRHVASEL
jgi:hypothetical protein